MKKVMLAAAMAAMFAAPAMADKLAGDDDDLAVITPEVGDANLGGFGLQEAATIGAVVAAALLVATSGSGGSAGTTGTTGTN
jgi:hypothetical protein